MTLTRREWLIGGGGLAFAFGMSPITSALSSDQHSVGGNAFGTYWRLTLPPEVDAKASVRAIEAVIVSVNRAMSPFAKRSEISRFNQRRTTGWQKASRQLRDVVAASLRIADATGGAFDPTVGPIVGRYGFGPIRGTETYRYTEIGVAEGAIRKTEPELTLDLCGIAKGHALDRMVMALNLLGVQTFMIELGGEVYGQGHDWKIGIERPLPGPEALHRIVALDGYAIATSGDRYNSFQAGDRRYNHIIDPDARSPVDGNVASVSVLASAAMEADALATALMVLGPDRGGELADKLKIPTLFLLREGTGVDDVAVAGFNNFLVQ